MIKAKIFPALAGAGAGKGRGRIIHGDTIPLATRKKSSKRIHPPNPNNIMYNPYSTTIHTIGHNHVMRITAVSFRWVLANINAF